VKLSLPTGHGDVVSEIDSPNDDVMPPNKFAKIHIKDDVEFTTCLCEVPLRGVPGRVHALQLAMAGSVPERRQLHRDNAALSGQSWKPRIVLESSSDQRSR
jgi:hypothetical protein